MISKRLIEKMNEQKISCAELAEKMGVSEWTITAWRHERYCPTKENLKKLADALNCTTDYLQGKDDNDTGIYRGMKRNSSGCADPTAFSALSNVLREGDSNRNVLRGDIYYIKKSVYAPVDDGAGRPAVVVSSDSINKSNNAISVVYLAKEDKTALCTHVSVDCKGAAVALCEQVHNIPKTRIGDFIKRCTDAEMKKIGVALEVALALNGRGGVWLEQTAETTQPDADALRQLESKIAERDAQLVNLKTENERLQKQIGCVATDADAVRVATERDLYKHLYEQMVDRLLAR